MQATGIALVQTWVFLELNSTRYRVNVSISASTCSDVITIVFQCFKTRMTCLEFSITHWNVAENFNRFTARGVKVIFVGHYF